jgi:hypothetical protein
LHALAKCGMVVYPEEPNHRQALGLFVYNYILKDVIAEQNQPTTLPYGVDLDDALICLEDRNVVSFMQRYAYTIDHIFNYFHLRGHRTNETTKGNTHRSFANKNESLSPEKGGYEDTTRRHTEQEMQYMSYSEFMQFCDTHLWFVRYV